MLIKEYTFKDEIIIFHDDIEANHEDYNITNLDHLFKVEKKHFWFITRNEFIYQNMNNVIDKSSQLIEIGAGTGNVSRYLKSKNYLDISVGDMHRKGLLYAQSYGINKCYQFDLLRVPFENEFDVVCMFDVLEHIADDIQALDSVNQILSSRGYIVLTVPAHQWLWNRSDVVAGHKRRYTKRELEDKLKVVGFEIISSRYFFMVITPLLWIRSLINKDTERDIINEEFDEEIHINSIINKVLLASSRIENKFNKYLPNWFGGSLFIIARKNDTI